MTEPRIEFDRTMLWILRRGYELRFDGHLDLTIPWERLEKKIGVSYKTIDKHARALGYRKPRPCWHVTP